jgi:hypothetical protein
LHPKNICFELKRLGHEAQTARDLTRAAQYFQTCVQLRERLSQGTDSMVIVRMVGIAAQSMGLVLPAWTHSINRPTKPGKLEAAHQHKGRLQAEINGIKNMRK